MKDVPHHVTQRGNNQQDVFFVDDDRVVYLDALRQQSQKFGLDVLGYCLMSNHIHLIAVPQNDTSLAKAIGRTHFVYTQYVNRIHGRSGHLWQNRFYSCAMDNLHTWQAMQYIETNPVRAGIVRKPWIYPYSSASAHVTGYDPSGVLNMKWWSQKTTQINWGQVLQKRLKKEQVDKIRLSTNRGRPLAQDSYICKLEKIVGRRIRPLPVGRPKRSSVDNERE